MSDSIRPGIPWAMDFDELDALDPVEVPDEAGRDLALVILGATGGSDWRHLRIKRRGLNLHGR